MPYPPANLQIEPRPRGLGELADRAGGFGTWVVDMRWGLSPPIITGQPRPYGPTVVQTYYPRSQAPRLTALQTGGVLAAGTWPQLLPATYPVFRTPVVRPGAQQISLPPGAGLTNGTALAAAGMAGIAGYGHIPLGVAHAPTELYERGVSGFGEEPTAGALPDNITALGKNIQLTPEDWQQVQAQAGTLQAIFTAWARTYIARAQQVDFFNFVVEHFAVLEPDYTARRTRAMQLAFGSPEGYHAAYQDLVTIDRLRKDVKAQFTPAEVAAFPTALRNAFHAFVTRDDVGTGAPYAGFGVEPTTIFGLSIGTLKLIAWVLAALTVMGAATKLMLASNQAAIFEAEAQRIRAQSDLALAQSEAAIGHAVAQGVDALAMAARTAPSEAQRLQVMQSLQELPKAWAAQRGKQAAERAAVGSGWGWAGLAAVASVALIAWGLVRFGGRGKQHEGGGSGGGAGVGGGESAPQRHGLGAMVSKMLERG